MSIVLLAATILAVLVLAVASSIQLLYLESLRLRTRDLPAMEFFKTAIEEKIGLETDDGAQQRLFSLWRHHGFHFLLLKRVNVGMEPTLPSPDRR